MLKAIERARAAQAQQKQAEKEAAIREPRDVLGSIVLLLQGRIPSSITDARVLVEPEGGAPTIIQEIAESQKDWSEWGKRWLAAFSFVVSLPAGTHRVRSLELYAPEMARHWFALPVDAEFTVPLDQECVYIGSLAFHYWRLRPAMLSEQKAVFARGGYRDFVYLPSGGLFLASRGVVPWGVHQRSKQLQRDADDRRCAFKFAVFEK